MKSITKETNKTVCAWLFIVVYFVVCLYIHMEQILLIPGKFVPSDLPAHIVISNEGWTIYSGIFLVIHIIYLCFSEGVAPYVVVSLFSLLDLLGVLVTAYFFKYIDKQDTSDFVVLVEAIALNIVLNCAMPGVASMYLNGNMWGNITYTAMKPFAFFTFFLFTEMRMKEYCKSFSRNYIMFVIFLTITTGLKPNFTISIMPLIGISVIYDFCKKRIPFKKALLLAMAFLPSFYIMYKQYRILFQGQGAGGTVFMPGYVLGLMSDYVVIMILLSVLFPLVVTIYNIKTIHKDIFSKSVLYLWLINFGIIFLFGENGYRQNHGNFLWGSYFATFLWFVDAYRWYWKNVLECKKDKSKKKIIMAIFLTIIFLLHLVSGIVYLVDCIV